MEAKATGRYSVKYIRGSRKWYRAILEIGYKSMRVSRKTFKRAHEAEEYRAEVVERLERMKGG
jgi:hypothetical protein